jgi:hypothetical protein
MVESADMKPAASARKAAMDSCAALQKSLQAWQKLNTDEVPGTNKLLENIHLAALPIAPARPELFCSD